MNAAMRKIGALCAKDVVDVFKNPTMAVVCLMPIGFMLLYTFIIGDVTAGADLNARQTAAASTELSKYLLGAALCMVAGMVGSMIVLYGIAEEKEKHSLRTLMLANVSASEVAVSKSVVALLMIAIIDTACFFIAGGRLEWLAPYLLLGIVGSLPVILVSLVLGLACRDQMTAGFYSVPVLLIALVPMFGLINETFARVASLTPLGGVHDLMSLAIDGALLTNEAIMPALVTLVWIIIGAVLFAALFRRLARDN